MSFWFGDSFDCYALPADALLGYWDSGTTSATSLIAGRFTNSRGLVGNSIQANILVKSSGSNDNIHHVSIAYQYNATLGAAGGTWYFTLSDAGTAQCSVGFGRDGAIFLTSGGIGGTVLSFWPTAFTGNVWNQFEIEVVIHNTVGSWAIRRNGNTVNDFSATGLNTRGGTANNYANRIALGGNLGANGYIDDLLWRSDAASVPWVGDVRCYTRRPDTDAAAAWTRPSTFQMQPYFGTTTNTSLLSNGTRYTPFISQGGSIGSVVVNLLVGSAGNIKCTIYASSSGQPTTVIQSATAPISSPVIGANTFIFSPAVSLARGTPFFVAVCTDTSLTNGLAIANTAPYSTAGFSGTTTYASFPVASPPGLSASGGGPFFPVVTPTYNADAVADAYEDAAASYVYSSAPGAQDLYTLTGISSTPSTIVGVTTRGLLTKSDAGTRLAAVQLRSGATTVQAAGALSNSAWGWLWRSDTTDPATGAAWTVSGVAAAQIGAQVTG